MRGLHHLFSVSVHALSFKIHNVCGTRAYYVMYFHYGGFSTPPAYIRSCAVIALDSVWRCVRLTADGAPSSAARRQNVFWFLMILFNLAWPESHHHHHRRGGGRGSRGASSARGSLKQIVQLSAAAPAPTANPKTLSSMASARSSAAAGPKSELLIAQPTAQPAWHH